MGFNRLLKTGALLFLTLLISASTYAGNEGAHGGAGVVCRPSPLNRYNGFYMLDYVIMRGGPGTRVWPYPNEFAQMTDANQILNWIAANLQFKLPDLAWNLAQFRMMAFTNYFGATVRWVPTTALYQTWDQGLGEQPWRSLEEYNFKSLTLPANCSYYEIYQVATKYQASGYVVFGYVPSLLYQLAAAGPEQISFLMIHEWLRNYSDDAEVIRRANRVLHSTAIVELSSDDLRKLLHEIGLF